MKRRKRREELWEAVAEGYRRLAFGPVGDAVKLMMAEEGQGLDYSQLDLQNVAELKRGKGTVEVRFFSRLEALDRLAQLTREEPEEEDRFYAALRAGAKRCYSGAAAGTAGAEAEGAGAAAGAGADGVAKERDGPKRPGEDSGYGE
jgi:hypothetical protein